MREIGSEFWIDEYSTPIGSNDAIDSNNQKFLLSGRTALEYVGRDAGIKSIMLPSYCCHTMIEPFVRNHIDVTFYSVGVDDKVNAPSKECDAVLLIDYFGYEMPSMKKIVKHFSENGKVIIYDGTHRLTGNSSIERYADYSICSYRKWAYSNFAMVKKHRGEFNLPIPARQNMNYIRLRDEAAEEKAKYIETGVGNKELFRTHYSEAEELLENDYVGYTGQPILLDIDYIVHKRRDNAELLISKLSSVEEIQLMRNSVDKSDTPLCVPILLKDEETRNKLRRYLISKDIYCPVHWPLSNLHLIDENDKEIYRRELSLVCDQRYDVNDMRREINEIRNFFERTAL